jgi:heme iron utilization protein
MSRQSLKSNMEEPGHAAQCRRICERARIGSLGTIARDLSGYPFVTLVSVAFDARGSALMLLSRLAEHTMNLESNPRASLLLTEDSSGAPDALAAGRVTLVGEGKRVDAAAAEACRAMFLSAHPEASAYAGFADFGLYRLAPDHVRYVGGFGRMSWVGGQSFATAWEITSTSAG